MEERKQRRKTGCLTCRLRRVKCDEERPMCHRCLAANLECAGYEERRRLDTGKLRHLSSKRQQHQVPGPLEHQRRLDRTTAVSIPDLVEHREDGLPLIGLPVNPTSSQRPHTRARDILAYHQFLFRTLPILFPSRHMPFWRDFICQQCWDIEYVYDTITALGSMHRAVLMLSQPTENDQNRGLDTKVIACQAYTRALQKMANVEKNTFSFVAVAVLCAYFECFTGNVLAVTRHFHTANHQARLLSSDSTKNQELHIIAIESALRDLAFICTINLPFPSEVQTTRFSNPSTSRYRATAPSKWNRDIQGFPSLTDFLQAILNFSSEDKEMRDLIWNPLSVCLAPISIEKAQKFYEDLNEWRGTLATILLTYDLDLPLLPPQNLTWETCRQLPIPPLPYPAIPTHLRLILSVYVFYAARIKWSMIIFNRDDNHDYELEAYFYFYQQLRLASTEFSSLITATTKHEDQEQIAQSYYACESLKIGFSPLLYLAGQCCYLMPTWMQWITHKLSELGQEGIFNSQIYVKNLESIDRFRRLSRMNINGTLPRFSHVQSNKEIILSLLIPSCRRRAYVAYYIRLSSNDKKLGANAGDNEHRHSHDVIGISEWGDGSRGLLDMTVDSTNGATSETFSTKWLLDQPIVQEWSEWMLNPEFRVDRVLTDHIVGGSLDRNTQYIYTEIVLNE